MRDSALESGDESFGESPAGIISGVGDDAGRDGATGTSPVGGFAEFMRMQLAHDDAVVDENRAAGRNARLVRSFERAYVENDARAAAALCRADCHWCDGERLVRGREKIAALLTKEWGEQSDRVQRTKVFTSGHNRVAACFEREYVARVPGDVPGDAGTRTEASDGASDDDARRKRARGEREPRRLLKKMYVARGAEFWDFDDDGFVRARVGIVTQTPVTSRETAIVGSSWSPK
jgi:nuclear transport factor 2 (NTF2) superfamily protein